MIKNKTSIVDDRGYNQGFKDTKSNLYRLERRAQWMMDAMDIHPSKKVLEIGCGTGYISYCIAKKTGMNVVGSDLCVPFIEQANKIFVLNNLHFQILDFNKVAQSLNPNDKFDYIIGNGILHHLYYNLDEALLNLKKILNPNGKIIFMEPNIYNPYVASIFNITILRKWAKLEPDEMAFSKSYIYKKLQNLSFENVQIEYKDFLLPGTPYVMVPPVVFISNFIEKMPLLKKISQSILIKASV